MRDLAAGLYEMCKDCEGWGDGCTTCWDEGIVLHECSDDNAKD